MTYDAGRGERLPRRTFSLGILGLALVGCQSAPDDPPASPSRAPVADPSPTTSAPPVDPTEIAWRRLTQDRMQASDVLLDSLEEGHVLWEPVLVIALDLVPDADLPVLVDAVAAHLPAEAAGELGRQLAFQVPELMREHERALAAAVPHFWMPGESRDGSRSLIALPAHHLVFPSEHVRPPLQPLEPRLEPPTQTWQPPEPAVGTGTVGGLVQGDCATCGRQLHLLLDLGTFSAPDGQPLPRQLLTCAAFSCLWAEQFFQHGDGATPESILPREFVPGEWDPEPLPEMAVTMHPTPPRWHLQDWGVPQNLNRLGGEGSWVQDAIHPGCPTCGLTMPLLAQFDSQTPFDGPGWAAWTEGIIYVYWCVDCRISATLKQQT